MRALNFVWPTLVLVACRSWGAFYEIQTVTISPPEDTYYTAQAVSLSSSVAGSTICYTTDGSRPACAATGACSSGLTYSAPIAMPNPILSVASFTVRAISCKSDVIDSPIATANYSIDTTLPILVATTPVNGATNVTPCGAAPTAGGCKGTFALTFNKRMSTAVTQSMTLEVWDGTVYQTIGSAASYTLTQTTLKNDTINVTPSIIQFPENAQIRVTVPAASLKDDGGNASAALVQRVFFTSINPIAFSVADTGIVDCYNASVVSNPCSTTAGTFPSQDADFLNSPNPRSFTGPTAHPTFTSDYTTTDNTTGLTWKTCSQGQSGAGCTGGTSNSLWIVAMNACATLNAANSGAGYAGRTNWHLPSIEELETLPNYAIANPSLETGPFPNQPGQPYWSSTVAATGPINAWGTDLSSGANSVYARSVSYSMRCVSGNNAAAAIKLRDNGDGTVSDLVTNLTWPKCLMDNTGTGTLLPFATNCAGTAGGRSWTQALQDCNNLTLAGRSWRVPSLNELKTFADRSVNTPATRSAFFPNAASGNYWSTSTTSGSPATAWTVAIFTDGSSTSGGTKASSNSVRCVASGS